MPETAKSFDFSSNWKESSLCLTAGTSMRYLWGERERKREGGVEGMKRNERFASRFQMNGFR